MQQNTLFSHLETILQQWTLFRKILCTILYTNLIEAKTVMKLIRGVYVDFNLCTSESKCVIYSPYDQIF